MIYLIRRTLILLLFLSISSIQTYAADPIEGEEPVIDVMGKVVDHDYFEIFNTKIYLPRFFRAGGQWYLYANTKAALASGEFENIDGALVRADGEPITLDMSITSHLLYVWFGILFALFITLWASSRYKKGIGRTTEGKGICLNLGEVCCVFIGDQIAKE